MRSRRKVSPRLEALDARVLCTDGSISPELAFAAADVGVYAGLLVNPPHPGGDYAPPPPGFSCTCYGSGAPDPYYVLGAEWGGVVGGTTP
jgi:hypothetical protein